MSDAGAHGLLRETRAFYDRHPFRSPIREGIARRRFFERLGVHGRVLDVGVGSGRTTKLVESLDPRSRVTSLDLSLATLRRFAHPRRVEASALELPFADRTFDAVMSIGVLHHTPDARRGFRECVRVLKPGGALAIMLYNAWNSYRLVYALSRRLPRWFQRRVRYAFWQDQLFTPQASFHSVPEVLGWFAEEGLSVTALETAGYLPPYFPARFRQTVYYGGVKGSAAGRRSTQ